MFQDQLQIITYFEELVNKIDLHVEEILEKEKIECVKESAKLLRSNFLATIEQLRDFNLKFFPDGDFKYCFFIPNTSKIQKKQELYGNKRTVFLFDNIIGKLIILSFKINDRIVLELT